MAVFLSAGDPDGLRDELLGAGSAYTEDTPVVIAHRVSWPDETVLHTTLGRLPATLRERRLATTVMILVGDALAPAAAPARRSHVYDPAFTHRYRRATPPPPAPAGGAGDG
jgi:precorrin-4/cobalt-precorrin-4 C11-methyltransferase